MQISKSGHIPLKTKETFQSNASKTATQNNVINLPKKIDLTIPALTRRNEKLNKYDFGIKYRKLENLQQIVSKLPPTPITKSYFGKFVNKILVAINKNDSALIIKIIDKAMKDTSSVENLIDITDDNKRNILHILTINNNLEVLSYLSLKLNLAQYINVQDDLGNTCLHYAALSNSKIDLINFLLDLNASVSITNIENEETPFHLACRFLEQSLIERLMKNKPCIDARTKDLRTPFHYLMQNKNKIELKAMFDNNNINYEEKLYNQENGKCVLGIYISLLPTKINNLIIYAIDQIKNTLLHDAIYYNKEDFAITLINMGARLDIKNKDGNTPIHFITKHKNINILRSCINRGADLNMINNQNFTLLDCIALEYDIDVTKSNINKIKNLFTGNKILNTLYKSGAKLGIDL